MKKNFICLVFGHKWFRDRENDLIRYKWKQGLTCYVCERCGGREYIKN